MAHVLANDDDLSVTNRLKRGLTPWGTNLCTSDSLIPNLNREAANCRSERAEGASASSGQALSTANGEEPQAATAKMIALALEAEALRPLRSLRATGMDDELAAPLTELGLSPPSGVPQADLSQLW